MVTETIERSPEALAFVLREKGINVLDYDKSSNSIFIESSFEDGIATAGFAEVLAMEHGFKLVDMGLRWTYGENNERLDEPLFWHLTVES